jgi:hypothetical protein
LKAQVGCETLLASGVQAGTDCRPSAALSDSESARLGHGAALQQFTGILDHNLLGCSCKLDLIVEPPAALEAGKWAWKENPEAPERVVPKQNLGRT